MSSASHEDRQPQEDKKRRPYISDNNARSMSLDSRDSYSGPREPPVFAHPVPPAPHSPSAGMMHPHPGYPAPHYHHHHHGKIPSHHLHSVITNSFSVDEERDDIGRGYGGRGRDHNYHSRYQHHYQSQPQHHPIREQDCELHGDDKREGWTPPNSGHCFFPPGASPKSNYRPYIQRAHSSSSGYYPPPSDPMKRSYYHHSLPSNQYSGHLPPEFMPPTKRSRMEPPRKEILVSPRGGGEGRSPSNRVLHRAQSFPLNPPWHGPPPPPPRGYPHEPESPRHSTEMSYGGGETPAANSTNNKYPHVSPASDADESSPRWRPGPVWTPSPHHSRHPPPSVYWDSRRPTSGPPRPQDKAHEKNSFQGDPNRDFSEKVKIKHRPSTGDDKMRMMVKAAAAASETNNAGNETGGGSKKTDLLLLSLPQDRVSLSETLCVVRENIEVFTATQKDVDAPAPGRKHAVIVGQVGLRCIHCRHTTRCSDRVKRAVCYPSSIKRIYRTVIDMKLDHFSQCRYVPLALKNRLDELKAIHTRSTGTTMQYFIHAAHLLGMKDSNHGVALRESKILREPVPQPRPANEVSEEKNKKSGPVTSCDSMSSGSWVSGTGEAVTPPAPRINSVSSASFETAESAKDQQGEQFVGKGYQGLVALSLPEDKNALSPLRCFLREQVCAFSATEKDIAVRAPTTFSISVGQVGIGCIHCVMQSAKLRSNRAVCFPFSIGRIYQSVADIQRFHFSECKLMPPDIKQKFLDLQSASSKGSKGLATRQYWVTSAKKIGLVDTSQGIRFGRDPSKPETSPSKSLDILAQVAFSVTTANKQLVLPEDKPCIAEFLYVVMEQLQPCRFTEADRNKRRLKDVGCIGVECKHCAGQVDSRKFFWSSVSAVESNFVSVHTHMLECTCVPQDLKDRLIRLKKLRKEQTAALRTGSQKAFFARVWKRLHDDEGDAPPTVPPPPPLPMVPEETTDNKVTLPSPSDNNKNSTKTDETGNKFNLKEQDNKKEITTETKEVTKESKQNEDYKDFTNEKLSVENKDIIEKQSEDRDFNSEKSPSETEIVSV